MARKKTDSLQALMADDRLRRLQNAIAFAEHVHKTWDAPQSTPEEIAITREMFGLLDHLLFPGTPAVPGGQFIGDDSDG